MASYVRTGMGRGGVPSVRPLLLDLFCKAGGAAVGYYRAGFDVVGVDIESQPRYPFAFVQGDALNPPVRLDAFDAIHASPPCQGYTALRWIHPDREYPLLIEPTRAMLRRVGLPYVIENVDEAKKHLISPVRVCGSAFGLDIHRHRWFESNVAMFSVPCAHFWQRPRFANTGKRRHGVLSSVVGVYGGSHFKGDNLASRSRAMGINWMQMDELSEAIPPSYTEFIGEQLLEAMRKGAFATA